jgi:hypothetical protein
MIEIWRAVPGYEGLYKVSSTGKVQRIGSLHPLKQGKNLQGRAQVTLSRDGVTVRYQVHRLMLEAFTGPCPEGMECRHSDGDHTHNVIGNLAWGTHTENMQDKVKHGTHTSGETHPNAKLTEADVKAIRASTGTYKAIASQYGVTTGAIQAVLTGRTWTHI